jgi:hypothetical protein
MTPRSHGFSTLFLLALTIFSVTLAAQARAESGMEWQFFEINDPGNKRTRRVYGVPETDNVQVSGACVHSSSVGANFAIVTFGADIGDLENGKDTDLRVSGGGFDHALKGKIFRATGEEGVSGVQVDIGNDDPLWRAFAEKDSLDYLVRLRPPRPTRGRVDRQFVRIARLAAQRWRRGFAEGDAGGAFGSAKELGTEAWRRSSPIIRRPRRPRPRLYQTRIECAYRGAAARASNAACRCHASCRPDEARSQNPRRPSLPSSTGPERCGAFCGSISTGCRRITPI